MSQEPLTDERRCLDPLLRLAIALIEAGYTGSETRDAVLSCAESLGMGGVEFVDMGRMVSLQYVLPNGESVVRTGSASTFGAIDCRAIKHLHRLVGDVHAGRVTAQALPGELDDLLSRPRASLRWTGTGMTVLAFAVAWQVGVGAEAAFVAAALQAGTSLVGALTGRFGFPRLFEAAAKASLAGPFVAIAHVLGLVSWVDAAACVAVVWMLLVPLPMLVATVVDAVGESYSGAMARGFVVVLTSGGIVMGGVVVLQLGAGFDLGDPRSLSMPVLPIALGLLFSAVGASANAMANGGGRELVAPAALIGVFTAGNHLLLIHVAGMSEAWASVGAAVTLGFVTAVWARFVPYPAGVLALLGITGALLPGLTVYQGIAREIFHGSGVPQFAAAVAIVVGLGVGVVLGARISSVVPARVGRHRRPVSLSANRATTRKTRKQ